MTLSAARKAKIKEYNHKWYWGHREEILAYQKMARIRDAEKLKERKNQPERKKVHSMGNKKSYYKVKELRPWTGLVRSARQRATEKNLEFSLTLEWGSKNWTGVCEISGIPFVLDRSGTTGGKPLSASIDRIDQKKGYTPENCRFILHCLNAFRHVMNDQEMYEIAKAFVKKFEEKSHDN